MICDNCKEEIKGDVHTSVLFGKVINGKTVVKLCEKYVKGDVIEKPKKKVSRFEIMDI